MKEETPPRGYSPPRGYRRVSREVKTGRFTKRNPRRRDVVIEDIPNGHKCLIESTTVTA